MSKYKLSDTLQIPLDTADKMIKDYFKVTFKLNAYLAKCRAYGVARGYIRTFKPYSYIRFFPEWREGLNPQWDKKVIGEIERASSNTPIQGSGAAMTKRALVKIREYIKENKLENKVFIVMTVHDQIDCEVEEYFAEEWGNIQARLMKEAGEEIIKSVPVTSEITISKVWTK
jgi:DNA polymerase I-like protein with 3'-5' exonuclease and polymerase domains